MYIYIATARQGIFCVGDVSSCIILSRANGYHMVCCKDISSLSLRLHCDQTDGDCHSENVHVAITAPIDRYSKMMCVHIHSTIPLFKQLHANGRKIAFVSSPTARKPHLEMAQNKCFAPPPLSFV